MNTYQERQEYFRQYHREYRRKNRDRLREYDKINRPRRRSKINQNKKRWYHKHRTEILKKLKKSKSKRRYGLMNYLCNGNICCQICSFKDIRALHLDHIRNDGFKDRKQFKTINALYSFYYKNPDIAKQRLQVLCSNCNWLKRYN